MKKFNIVITLFILIINIYLFIQIKKDILIQEELIMNVYKKGWLDGTNSTLKHNWNNFYELNSCFKIDSINYRKLTLLN